MNCLIRFFSSSDSLAACTRLNIKVFGRFLLVSIGLAVCSLSVGHAGENLPSRVFVVDDLFKQEALGEYFGGPFAFSSSGTLAFARARPTETVADHRWEWLLGNEASDIWLQSGFDEPVNLTHGQRDGSGWWAPEWSPDGDYLAMLSTRGGSVRAWIWDSTTAKLMLAVDEPVDARGDTRPFLWLSNTHLLLPLMPTGSTSSDMQVGMTAPEIASRQWVRMATGAEPTVSVLDSGKTQTTVDAPLGRLVTVDIATGKERTIFRGRPSVMSTSPNGKFIAYMHGIAGLAPTSDGDVSYDNESHVLRLVTIGGSNRELKGDQVNSVVPGELHWSPDGKALAIVGQSAGKGGTVPTLHLVNPDTENSTRILMKMLGASDQAPQLSKLQWTGSGDIIFRLTTCGGDCGPEKREWWLIGLDGASQKINGFSGEPPATLWPQLGRDTFFGLSGESLVRIHSRRGVEKLGGESGEPVARLDWPEVEGEDGDVLPPDDRQGFDQLVFTTRGDNKARTFIMDLSTETTVVLETPGSDARLVAYDRSSRSALYHRSDETGLRLWRVWADGGRVLTLVDGNSHLREIHFATAKMIQYRGLDGAALEAWLLLPPDLDKSNPVPLLTWVYAGSSVSDRLPWGARSTSATPFNLQIPVGQGYAVLIPSMPISGENTEPMSSLANGVLPAIDRVIQEGHVDPKRVYLMGHSYGGYSTLGLITQTERFAAAVSIAGISNLVSMYGQFDSRMRYTDQAVPDALRDMLWTEIGQGRMAEAPWKRPERYIRNSPLFHVENVSTPIMIIQGDLDAVAIQQGEEFFTALYRTGKRAQFVRYWGEGHIPRSPANVRDMWERIFAWLEQFPSE